MEMETVASSYVVRGSNKIDKIKLFGWTIKDKPGVYLDINKCDIKIDPEYQRTRISYKRVNQIASEWSWVACGAITVARRSDGTFYAMNGQHRILGARKRSDIEMLPCLVFEIDDVECEAMGFVRVNTNRGPMSAAEKHKALLTAREPTAVKIDNLLTKLGLTAIDYKKPSSWNTLNCVASIRESIIQDEGAAILALTITRNLCRDEGVPINERVFSSLFYIQRMGINIADKRFLHRLEQIGFQRLDRGARRMSDALGQGGTKVWAQGILNEINKGLRNKYEMIVENGTR